MDELVKAGMLCCTATVAYLSYLQFQSFLATLKANHDKSLTNNTYADSKIRLLKEEDELSEREETAPSPAVNTIEFRQRYCNHDWSTYLIDMSGYDIFDGATEDDQDFIDGQFHYRCERCQVEEGHQAVRIPIKVLGYGNKFLPGRLSLEVFAGRLIDQTRNGR